MVNLIDFYSDKIINSARSLDKQFGISLYGLYDFLGEIQNYNVTAETVRDEFNSWFNCTVTKVSNEDVPMFESMKKSMLSDVLDFVDLCCCSFHVTKEDMKGFTNNEDKAHYWFYTFPTRSFIFSYEGELYRCYDDNGNAKLECIGIGSQADKAIFSTSIRNRETDIVCTVDDINCTNTSCKYNPVNGGICNLFRINHSGCMEGCTPVDIMLVAKYIMLTYAEN